MIGEFLEQLDKQVSDVADSVDQTVTQLFTPQTYIPEGIFGNPMIDLS
jgi:hypothetical protein